MTTAPPTSFIKSADGTVTSNAQNYQAPVASAPTTAGSAWTYDKTDANVAVNQEGTQDAPNGGVYARVLKINDDGSIDVTMTDGRDMTIKTWNGKPVTKKVSTVVSGAADTQPLDVPNDKPLGNGATRNNVVSHYELNPDALPNLRTTKGGDGNNAMYFDTQPAGYKQVAKSPVKIGDAMATMARMAGSNDPNDVANFKQTQKDLYDAGFTGGKKLQDGVFDQDFQAAYDAAMNSAAASGLTFEKTIEKGKAANPNGPITDQTGNALVVTSPDDIKAAVRSQATSVLGYQPDQKLIDHLTTKYNAIEAAGSQAKIDAQAKGTGGTSTVIQAPPSVANFVEGELRQSDPTASQGASMGHLFAEFSNLLGGTAPSPTAFSGGSNL